MNPCGRFDVPHRDQAALRIHDDALSATGLAARHPRTFELLSSVNPCRSGCCPWWSRCRLLPLPAALRVRHDGRLGEMTPAGRRPGWVGQVGDRAVLPPGEATRLRRQQAGHRSRFTSR
ncbi:hypothetical protein E6R62_36110 [Streptomyces sp. A1136]|nr:hypothetical protein E6R62_36110 [Streptomyces sp. A1136]